MTLFQARYDPIVYESCTRRDLSIARLFKTAVDKGDWQPVIILNAFSLIAKLRRALNTELLQVVFKMTGV